MAKATVSLNSVDDVIQGVLYLEQETYDAPTKIHGEIVGLTPGKHGISIHVFGDVSQEGQRVGPNFNPYNKNHGGPQSDERHVGSLGNIEVNAEGKALVKLEDRLVKLIGPQSVIGRSFVISKREDDLGKGGNESSLKNGNTGDPVAYGVIGISM